MAENTRKAVAELEPAYIIGIGLRCPEHFDENDDEQFCGRCYAHYIDARNDIPDLPFGNSITVYYDRGRSGRILSRLETTKLICAVGAGTLHALQSGFARFLSFVDAPLIYGPVHLGHTGYPLGSVEANEDDPLASRQRVGLDWDLAEEQSKRFRYDHSVWKHVVGLPKKPMPIRKPTDEEMAVSCSEYPSVDIVAQQKRILELYGK